MSYHYFQRDHCRLSVLLILITTCFVIAGFSQDSDPKLLSVPEFVLSQEAVAAGIDGTMFVSFTVDKTGAVKDVFIHSGPAWPCGASPGKAIDHVHAAVKENLRAAKFSPMIRDGKPRDAELSLSFVVGDAYRKALKEKDYKDRLAHGEEPTTLLNAGVVSGRALSLPKPPYPSAGRPSRATGQVPTTVVIDEEGNVVTAGILGGNPIFHNAARSAACDAKFSPTLINGKPVRLTGTITYNFVP